MSTIKNNKDMEKNTKQKTEAEQIHLSVMADKGRLADFLEDLAKCIRSDGEDFNLYETWIGCAEITN